MTETLINAETIPKQPPTIGVHGAFVYFSVNAIKKLNLKEGDRISFHYREGVLRMFFDPKRGFAIRRGNHINSKDLCNNLERLCGKKMLIGEFKDGYYVLKEI